MIPEIERIFRDRKEITPRMFGRTAPQQFVLNGKGDTRALNSVQDT